MCGPIVNGQGDSRAAGARQVRMLRTAMGPTIAAALADPDVVEVMANPDGTLWLDRLTSGRERADACLSPTDAERIIRLVAAHLRLEAHTDAPVVSGELPETGERFEGVLPPVTRAPAFAIRKRAESVIPLARYVEDGVMTAVQAQALRAAVIEGRNIVVVGGTSTGKTTLINALLQVMAETGDRVVLLEDTVELQCLSEDHVPLRTRPEVATMAQLVRSILRMRPDRIVVGEVRGPEALDLLKAWGTGHRGGVASIHGDSVRGGLFRFEQLVQEAVVTVPRALIAEAIDLVVHIAGRGTDRRVREIARVVGLEGDDYRLEP